MKGGDINFYIFDHPAHHIHQDNMNEKTQDIKLETVDLKAVFKSKSPRLARFIPGFIFRYLRKVLHEDDINYMLTKYGHMYDLDYCDSCINEFNVSIETHGTENLDTDKKYIIVANHPLGGFDGIVLMQVVGGIFKELKFLVNDILMNIKNFHGLFIPINKHGKQALAAARQIEQAFESDAQILTFPAGLVSRKIKGRVLDLAWQKSFIQKSVKYKRDVVPVHFSGGNTNFFYRLANFRKFFGIKANLEMFYLIDETWKHKNKHLILRFGKPIPWQTFDKSKKPAEWAKWVKEELYALNGIYDIPL